MTAQRCGAWPTSAFGQFEVPRQAQRHGDRIDDDHRRQDDDDRFVRMLVVHVDLGLG